MPEISLLLPKECCLFRGRVALAVCNLHSSSCYVSFSFSPFQIRNAGPQLLNTKTLYPMDKGYI